jgi:hypothetical protein
MSASQFYVLAGERVCANVCSICDIESRSHCNISLVVCRTNVRLIERMFDLPRKNFVLMYISIYVFIKHIDSKCSVR